MNIYSIEYLFTTDYNKIIDFTKKYTLNDPKICVEEIVSEAFIIFCESKKDYTFDTFIGYIKKAGRPVVKLGLKLLDIKKYKSLEIRGETTMCTKCYDVLPISLFSQTGTGTRGNIYYSRVCKNCTSKKYNEQALITYPNRDKNRQKRNLIELYKEKGYPIVWAKHIALIELGFKQPDDLYNYIKV